MLGRKIQLFSVLLGAALILSGSMFGATQSEDLQKKYAPILGDYEFDLADLGMGVITANVYVEGDSLYIWPQTSNEAAVMEAVEGKELEFILEDPDEGTYQVQFIKSEDGQYSCRIINETMGLDVTGKKIK